LYHIYPKKTTVFTDNLAMDIQSLSVNMTQNRVQEEAAVSVQAMALQTIKDAAADLQRLMESAKITTDPAKGNFLNVLM